MYGFFYVEEDITTGYVKGANAERELIKLFFGKGFAVTRAAGSGVSSFPCPDIVALRPGKLLAIECKAWNQNYLSVAVEQMRELEKWSKMAGSDIFIAWKLPRKGWFFLQPRHFKKNNKFFVISKKKALKQGLPIEVVSGEQAILKVKK